MGEEGSTVVGIVAGFGTEIEGAALRVAASGD